MLIHQCQPICCCCYCSRARLQEYTPAAEVAALLVAFRLWRLVRILHATTELAEVGHVY